MEKFNYETIKIENVNFESGNIFQIKLSRENSLNALNLTMLDELKDVINIIKNDDDIKSIVITGSGEKAFCAGADIKQLILLDKETGYSFAKSGQEIFNKIETLGKPVIAAINGYCFGGGLELAMACTIRIASKNALFGQPEIKLGIIPGYGGTQRLSRIVGKTAAMHYCLTGENISIDKALKLNLISDSYNLDELLINAYKISKQLNNMPKNAMASIIETINVGYDLDMEKALELEAINFGDLCDTQDKAMGVTAFLNKTKPVFD